MAVTSIGVFLMLNKTGNTYEKLVDIKDFPDMGGEPEMIEITTLSDLIKKYVKGIQDTGALKFTMNFTKEDFAKVKLLESASQKFALWIGGKVVSGVMTPDGSNGKFEFGGDVSVYVNGSGVSEAINATITIAVSTEINFSDT